jgi:hypothetical protein
MRKALITVGILIFLIGIVWTLQGINILQGSIMSGDSFWRNVGIVLLIVGPLISYFGWRRGATP